jgi:hypothetical protein
MPLPESLIGIVVLRTYSRESNFQFFPAFLASLRDDHISVRRVGQTANGREQRPLLPHPARSAHGRLLVLFPQIRLVVKGSSGPTATQSFFKPAKFAAQSLA